MDNITDVVSELFFINNNIDDYTDICDCSYDFCGRDYF